MNNANMYDVQCGWDPSVFARDDQDDGPGHDELLMNRVNMQDDEEGGRVRGDGDEDDEVYSSVQRVGNEKVAGMQRWSRKTGQLTRSIDQNQTSIATRDRRSRAKYFCGRKLGRLFDRTRQTSPNTWSDRIV